MSQNQSNMFAISMMDDGNRITYAYNKLDTSGNILQSNNRDTCIILSTNTEVTNAINTIKSFINVRINPTATITINYVDENNNTIMKADVYTDVPLGNNTYSYKDLSYLGYELLSNSNYTVTLTSDNPSQIITFTYKKVTGSVTINYTDVNGNILSPQSINADLIFGQTYTYNPITISGYNINDISQNITISQNNLNPVITFMYTQQLGTITVKYQSNNVDLVTPDVINNVTWGTYVEDSKNIDGYILNDTTSKQIIINANSLNVEVVFNYTQIGFVTINYLDNSNNVIAPQSVNSNLTVGQTYNYSPIEITGYSTTDIAKDITITSDNLNQVINFVYSKIKGSLTVKYQNEADNTDIATEKVENNLDWNSYTENAIDIDGYTINGDNTQTVIINADSLNPMIIFKYTQNPVGSVTINYVDDVNSTSIQTPTINSNLVLGTYNYDAPTIAGYILSTTDTSPKSVTLTSDNLNQTIEFIYTVNAQ